MKQILHALVKYPLLLRNLQPHQLADFCQQLCEENEVLDEQSALELLTVFCRKYWQFDTLQASCYENFCALVRQSTQTAKIALIPELMAQSIVCNNMVFLAKELIENLSLEERKQLKTIYLPSWTRDDEYSSICEDEFIYRQSKGLKCWKEEDNISEIVNRIYYRRPSCFNDFQCYYAMLDVIMASEQQAIIYSPGW